MKMVYFFLTFLAFFTCGQNQVGNASQAKPQSFETKLSEAAISIIDPNITYDPTYFSIKYPNGDVPKDKGVCTDVIIRAYRKLDIDLQKEVHEDMIKNFSSYPNVKKWGLHRTDTNIEGFRTLRFSFAGKVKNYRFQKIRKIIKPANWLPG